MPRFRYGNVATLPCGHVPLFERDDGRCARCVAADQPATLGQPPAELSVEDWEHKAFEGGDDDGRW